MKVVIAGAGIGGLTTALCLHSKGIDVELFEAAPELVAKGHGINVLPHASRVLSGLGLADALDAEGLRISNITYVSRYGQFIADEPRDMESGGFSHPQYMINRGELQMILYRAVLDRIGNQSVHTGHALDSFTQDASGVTVRLLNPAKERAIRKARGDILIGADGIKSRVRSLLYPDEGLPRYTGMMMYRGEVEAKSFLDGTSMLNGGNFKRQVVIYPVSAKLKKNGRDKINWVVGAEMDNPTAAEGEIWSSRADREMVAQLFEDYRWEVLDVPALIRSTEDVFQWPLCDRDPVGRWSFDRVALLGDAAHPMMPRGANGAGQAVLDGEAIAEALANPALGPVEALLEYQRQRLQVANAVVLNNRVAGPEKILRLVDERLTSPKQRVTDVISKEEIEEAALSYRKLAQFDPEQLLQKESNKRGG
jgi:2-polyprenyl-6-methoxyphenol hydroxylase-like FAD-dependent oxidoreductase